MYRLHSLLKGQQLQDIRLGTDVAETRAVIEFDAPLAYKVFFLASPPRLVVDVQGLQRSDAFRPSQTRQGLVRNVRLGQFSDTTVRIVFDLTQTARLEHARPCAHRRGGAIGWRWI